MLRLLNLHALYFSGALFLVYMAGVLTIGVLGWWISLNLNEGPYRWVWPQSGQLLHNVNVIWLLVASLVGVGAWYMRPNSNLSMLFWGVLPALVAVVLWIFPTKADHANKNKTVVSARRRYSGSYALVVTTVLFAGVVMPALVSFRIAVDVEWRLLAKFSQYDFDRDRALQVQAVRKFYHAALYDTTSSEVRVQFFQSFWINIICMPIFRLKAAGRQAKLAVRRLKAARRKGGIETCLRETRSRNGMNV